MLKIGGLYKVKGEENRWILIQKKLPNGNLLIHDIIISPDEYDVDITEISPSIIEGIVEDECYSGIFRNKVLYAIWDGANKHTKRIINPYAE